MWAAICGGPPCGPLEHLNMEHIIWGYGYHMEKSTTFVFIDVMVLSLGIIWVTLPHFDGYSLMFSFPMIQEEECAQQGTMGLHRDWLSPETQHRATMGRYGDLHTEPSVAKSFDQDSQNSQLIVVNPRVECEQRLSSCS